MKILMVSRYCFPEILGGAHKYMYEIARKFAEKNHEVHLVHYTGNPEAPKEEISDGIQYHRYYVEDKGSLANNYKYVTNTYSIAKEVKEKYGADIINFHDVRVPLRLYNSKDFASLPFVFTCQADTAYEYVWDYKKLLRNNPPLLQKMKIQLRFPFHYFWHRYCFKRGLERTNGIVVLSDYVRNTIRNNYGEKYDNKIKKIPSGVDINIFYPPKDGDEKLQLRQRFGLPTNKIVFLTARRMALRMGWFNLEDAIKMLFDNHPLLRNKIHFVFMGDGDILSQVKQHAKNLGIYENIIFTGGVYKEVPLYYRASDCFILPTEELEGFGIVSVEAFASGIPVIGTPSSAVPEVLREVDPDLVTKNKMPDGICDGIHRMLKKMEKGELNSQYIRDIAVKKFSWEVVISQLEEYYTEIIEKYAQTKPSVVAQVPHL